MTENSASRQAPISRSRSPSAIRPPLLASLTPHLSRRRVRRSDYLDLPLDSVLETLKPAVNAVRSARPKSHLPMPLDELMWPSRPTPILGTPQSAASCSATCGAQYGSLSLDTITPGSSS